MSAFTHALFIVIIFVLPELMMAIAMPHRRPFGMPLAIYGKTLIYIAAFYINYYWLIGISFGREGRERHLARFILLNIVILLIGMVGCHYISCLWHHGRPPMHDSGMRALLKSASFLIRDGVMMVLIIGLAVALRLSAMWKDVEQRRQEAVSEQRATELANLKSQLNPHFLFNALNSIYALIDISPDDAKDAVHRLSGLLRYMLYEDVSVVRLSQELDFIRDYVSLMKLRISGREIVLNIDDSGFGTAGVPPLLLIPIVENAFKYGNTLHDKTPIVIDIRCEDGWLVCRTENSYAPQPADRPKESGIGLANLRRRLVLIYGNDASLSTRTDGSMFRTELKVPLDRNL